MVMGYISCFLAGAAVCLAAVFLCRMMEEKRVDPPHDEEHVPSEAEQRIAEQWVNMLNYTGEDQNGE